MKEPGVVRPETVSFPWLRRGLVTDLLSLRMNVASGGVVAPSAVVAWQTVVVAVSSAWQRRAAAGAAVAGIASAAAVEAEEKQKQNSVVVGLVASGMEMAAYYFQDLRRGSHATSIDGWTRLHSWPKRYPSHGAANQGCRHSYEIANVPDQSSSEGPAIEDAYQTLAE